MIASGGNLGSRPGVVTNGAREAAVSVVQLRMPSFPRLRNFRLLLGARPVEEVVGRVRDKLSLADGARCGRRGAPLGVQTLNESSLGEQVSPRRPLLVSD